MWNKKIANAAIATKCRQVCHGLLMSWLVIGYAGTVNATQQAQNAPTENTPAIIADTAHEIAPEIKNISAAHVVVEDTTTALLTLIDEAKTYIEEDDARFYTELGELLKQFVDFDSFARGVMGAYASPARIASLSAEQKQRLSAQIARFSDIFTESLINTYGRGLLVFDGERIEVLPPQKSAEERAIKGKAVVKQLIFGDREQPYEIYYSLRRSSDNDWKIRNMIIESSNLGKIYRNQFDNAYKVYEGDIDKVIDNWAVSNEEVESDTASKKTPEQATSASL